jgi:ParB family chromosome partitioning protein
LTQEKLSERVGKKRATIANYLRLLKLPAPVQVAIQNHQIDTGHARSLLALDDPKAQIKVFNEIQNKGYSVRQVEELIKEMNEGDDKKHVPSVPSRIGRAPMTEELEAIRAQLSSCLGIDVKISCTSQGGGKVSFSYKSTDDLRRILSLFQ